MRTSRDYDRGRTTEDALNLAFEKDAKDLLTLEETFSFPRLSDGQLRWQDFIRPFSESVSGLESGADLSRWFDTNTFYKKPTVTKKLSTDGSFVDLKKYSGDEHKEKANRSLALPGPFTLASLVDDQFYNSKEELVHEFARVLRNVIDHLSKNGYSHVQINEPSLVYRYGESALNNGKNLEAFTSAFREELGNLKLNVTLHTYFGDCSQILKALLGLPGISTIGVDFTQTPIDNLSSLEFDGKGLGVGCVDARSSLVESPEWISEFCTVAFRSLKPSGLLILPSSDLKYLPRTYADQKIQAIGNAVELVGRNLARGEN